MPDDSICLDCLDRRLIKIRGCWRIVSINSMDCCGAPATLDRRQNGGYEKADVFFFRFATPSGEALYVA
jgi:hypothetical protein